MRSKLTRWRAEEAEGLVAEGLTLDAIAARIGVNRRTILRWVDRDDGFRERYARARRFAHEMLYDELQEVILRSDGSPREAYAARRTFSGFYSISTRAARWSNTRSNTQA